jgi:hypothetical protein
MSVSIVTAGKPYKLLEHLEKRYSVTAKQRGIYIIDKDTSPTQIIVSRELPEDENLWLNSLNKELTAVRLERILMATARRGKDAAVRAYVNVVTESNIEAFQEVILKIIETPVFILHLSLKNKELAI